MSNLDLTTLLAAEMQPAIEIQYCRMLISKYGHSMHKLHTSTNQLPESDPPLSCSIL